MGIGGTSSSEIAISAGSWLQRQPSLAVGRRMIFWGQFMPSILLHFSTTSQEPQTRRKVSNHSPHVTKSPTTPMIIGFVAALVAGCCWLLSLPPVDTSQWSEKMWSVHRTNHFTEDLCMMVFALLAVLFFGIASYRWFGSRRRR